MSRIIDLSHPLRDGQSPFPGDPPLRIVSHATIPKAHFNLARLSIGTHQGTHLDAPFHFFDDGTTVDRIPLDRFYGPATLVDLAPRRRLKAGTPLTLEMLRPHARAFRPGARVICRTGWDRMFGREEYYTGCPSLTIEAARWIASRRIGLLGMDTPTPSHDWLECHRALLRKGVEIVIVEGLANLEKLPKRFIFVGLPLKLAGRDGSPIRAAAVVRG